MNKLFLWLLIIAANLNIANAQLIGSGRRGGSGGGSSSTLDTANIVYKNRDASILNTLNFSGSPIFNQSSTSPLWKTVNGTLLTTPQAGAWEVSGDIPYYTINTGTARKQIMLADATLTSGRVTYSSTNGRQTDLSTFIFNTTTGGRLSVGTTSATSNLNVGASVGASGNNPLATFTGAAHTGQTASTELFDVLFNFNRNVQFATGALATQRSIAVSAPTYSFVGPSTITTAATLAINGAPVAGTNATITNPYAFWVQAGTSRMEGNLSVGGSIGTVNLTTNGSFTANGASSFGTAPTFTDTWANYQAKFGSTGQGGIISFARGSDGAFSSTIGYTSNVTASDFAIKNIASGGTLSFHTTSNVKTAQLNSSGLIVQPAGGTYVDAGFGLDIQGTSRFTGALTGAGSTWSGIANFQDTWANGQARFGSGTQAGRILFSRGGDGNPLGTIGYSSATDGSEFTVSSTGGSANVNLQTANGVGYKLYYNGTSLFQNGGTYTLPTATGVQFNHSITASSGLARGMTVTPTLTAAANNDGLYAIDVNPTYVPGSFTGTLQADMRIGHILPKGNSLYSLGNSATVWANVYSSVFWGGNFLNTASGFFGTTNTASTIGIRQGAGSQLISGWFGNTGNAYDQASGVAPTDNGYRRQIYGDLFVSGNQLINGQINSTQTATSAIMNITPGTLKTTTVAGDLEANADKLYYVIPTGVARKEIALIEPGATLGQIPLYGSNNRLSFNAGFQWSTTGGFKISVGSAPTSATLGLTGTAQTSGSNPLFVATGAAHTGQSASETNDIFFNLARTVQFATGNFPDQRAVRINAPTYSATGASTITTPATVAISGAPIAGTNMTFTNAYALNIESGNSRFNGNGQFTGGLTVNGAANINATNVTNNATVGGTLGVTGNATMSNNLTVNGNLIGVATSFQNVTTSSNVSVGTTLDVAGATTAASYKVSALNTAPASATATGTTGEIRITAGFIYVCTGANTWVRSALTTW